MSSPIGSTAARHAARAELRHHEYDRDQPSLISRILHWLGRHLDSLFAGGAGGHAVLVLVVILLAVVIAFAVRSGMPRAAGRTARGVDPLAATSSVADHRRRALQWSAEGVPAEALREWLRAAVRTIEDRGVLAARPGRTGAATAREAGPVLPDAAADLATATAAFDEVWFGGRTATDADVAHARAAAERAVTARIVTPSGADWVSPQ